MRGMPQARRPAGVCTLTTSCGVSQWPRVHCVLCTCLSAVPAWCLLLPSTPSLTPAVAAALPAPRCLAHLQGLFSEESFWKLGLSLIALQQMLLGGPPPLPLPAPRPPAPRLSNADEAAEAEASAADGKPAPAEPPAAADGEATDRSSSGSVEGGDGEGGSPDGKISWLKAALLASDALVTVSPGYALELQAAEADAGAQAQLEAGGGGAFGDEAPAPGEATTASAADAALRAGSAPAPQRRKPQRPGWPADAADELAGILQRRGLEAISNGLDTIEWDPSADVMLPRATRYTVGTVGAGKAAAKAALQARLGLRLNPDAPLFGFVGRLEEQKGADVILAALPALMGPPAGVVCNALLEASRSHAAELRAAAAAAREAAPAAEAGAQGPQEAEPAAPKLAPEVVQLLQAAGGGTAAALASDSAAPNAAAAAAGLAPVAPSPSGMQLVMLGEGDSWLQQCLSQLQAAYPGRASGVVGFDEPLCHLLMAGCDYLLVPSRWEPCGLVVLAALRYGTVPIVAPVGGLPQLLLPAAPALAARAEAAGVATDDGDAAAAPVADPAGEGRQQQQQQKQEEACEELLVAGGDGPTPDLLGCVMDCPVGPSGDSAAVREASASLARAVRAMLAQHGSANFLRLRARCMQQDVSWGAPAEQWEKLLLRVAASGSGCEGGVPGGPAPGADGADAPK